MAKVWRTRYTDGVRPDEISCFYKGHVTVVERNNDNWPRHGLILTNGEWKDGMREAPPGHEYLRMYGASILLVDGGDFVATGFVAEEEFHSNVPTKWVMERWNVRF